MCSWAHGKVTRKVSPDRVAHALDGLDPDQQQELRYRFQRETGTALGDDLAKVN